MDQEDGIQVGLDANDFAGEEESAADNVSVKEEARNGELSPPSIKSRLGESSNNKRSSSEDSAQGSRRKRPRQEEPRLTDNVDEKTRKSFQDARRLSQDWCSAGLQGFRVVTPRVCAPSVSDLTDQSGRSFLCPYCSFAAKHSRDVKKHVAEKHLTVLEYYSRQLKETLALPVPPASRDEWLDVAELVRGVENAPSSRR